MKRISLFTKFLSLVFAVAVVYTVSVREVHYLFLQHETHEHCENHLHAEDHHEDCSVCKFDISLFTDKVFTTGNFHLVFAIVNAPCIYQSPVTNLYTSFLSLRGPPYVA